MVLRVSTWFPGVSTSRGSVRVLLIIVKFIDRYDFIKRNKPEKISNSQCDLVIKSSGIPQCTARR